MSRLRWDQTADRRFVAGVDRGVFYPLNEPGEVWNGLTSVQESSSDADERVRYLDGVRTRTRRRPGEFEGTIEAWTYPESFYEKSISPRNPKPFGMSYRVKTESSYRIHILYNVLLKPSQALHEQGEATSFSWDFTTRPIAIPNSRPTAHLVVDAQLSYPEAVQAFENTIYGSEVDEAQLPSSTDLFNIFEENALFRVIDHGDGTWTATGPDDVITMLDPTTFQIDYSSAVYINEDEYTLSSF